MNMGVFMVDSNSKNTMFKALEGTRVTALHIFKKYTPNSPKAVFWTSFLTCSLVCLFIIFVLAPLTGISQDFGGNPHDGYLELARNLAYGNGYVFEKEGPRVFHRPPLYPFILVPITLFPLSLQRPILILVQSLMVGGICALMFNFSAKLFNLTAAKISLIVFLLYPWVYWNAKNPMTPILQGFLYLYLIDLIYNEIIINIKYSRQKIQHNLLPPWLLIGMTGALLALTHGTMIAASGIWIFIYFLASLYKRKFYMIVHSMAAGVICIMLISPWTYRNWIAFNRFIPVSSGAASGYFHGKSHWKSASNPPKSSEDKEHLNKMLRFDQKGKIQGYEYHFWGLKDSQEDQDLTGEMIEDIIDSPGNLFKKTLYNSIEYYFPAISYPLLLRKTGLTMENLTLTIVHLALWFYALFGCYSFWNNKEKRKLSIFMMSSVVLYSIWYLPFLTFVGHSLYTFGTIPFLCVLSSKGLMSIWDKGITIDSKMALKL